MSVIVNAYRLLTTKDGRDYLFGNMPTETWATNNLWAERLNRLWCRVRGHPPGEIFFNAGGLEPDHRCHGCGEPIG